MPAAGLVAGGIGLIGSAISRGNSNDELDQLMKEDPTYKENPQAKQRLSLAQTLFNARMPGATAAERGIFSNQANTMGRFQRNATDSSQLLALGAAAQGQTNEALQDLSQQEAMDYQRRYGNLVGAQQGVINEGDKVYEDSTRRFGNKVQMTGAKQQNNAATWQDIANFGFSAASLGAGAGWQDFNFGGGGGNPGANAYKMPRQNYDPQLLPYR